MPFLRAVHPRGQRVTGQGETGGWEWASEWMGEVMEDREAEPVQQNQQQQSKHKPTFWSLSLRPLGPWYSLAPVAVVWFVCQLEALFPPSLPLEDLCFRLFLLCFLWIVLGGCIHALKCCLKRGPIQEEPPLMKQQAAETENRRNLFSWMLQTKSPHIHVPLTVTLADCLLLCVLHEPLQEPSLIHIGAFLSRLEAVALRLERTNVGSEAKLDDVDQSSMLADKLRILCSYLQQRTESLRALVQAQGDFESSVKDLLQGFDGLWAQLEELHTGVTLTKQEGQNHRDLTSVQMDTKTLVVELDQYRNKLQSCEALLKDSTQLLQALTWSHSHMGNKLNSSCESVWPELLLQSNIEQFDKVQESFISLEQQTAAFQTHLEGLGKGSQKRPEGPLALANGACLSSVSPQTSTSAGTKTQTPSSLREKSVQKISSTLRCLHRPGKKT